MQKKLFKDKDLAHKYEKLIEEYLKEEIIKKVTKTDYQK